MAGRPSFNPTKAQRRRVTIAAGGGMSHEEIALVLGISRNTLEKHFELELSVGAYERRLEVLEAMHKAGKAGNVAAAREYCRLAPHVAAPPSEPAPGKPVATGKKEQRQAEAKTAQVGTDWESLLDRTAPIQ